MPYSQWRDNCIFFCAVCRTDILGISFTYKCEENGGNERGCRITAALQITLRTKNYVNQV